MLTKIRRILRPYNCFFKIGLFIVVLLSLADVKRKNISTAEIENELETYPNNKSNQNSRNSTTKDATKDLCLL